MASSLDIILSSGMSSRGVTKRTGLPLWIIGAASTRFWGYWLA